MSEIFISSSGGASALARKLARDLEKLGFQTFLPIRDIAAGALYPQILARISRADAFLVLVESKPERSAALEQEWFAILNEASDSTQSKKDSDCSW